jgi:hypothetical protein
MVIRKARTRFTYMVFFRLSTGNDNSSLALVLNWAPSGSLRACPEPAEGTRIKYSTKMQTFLQNLL